MLNLCHKYKISLFAGPGVQDGDSGAGLAYKHSFYYFLTGIVSVKEKSSSSSIAAFTDIQKHIQWIRSIYVKHVESKEKESCYPRQTFSAYPWY